MSKLLSFVMCLVSAVILSSCAHTEISQNLRKEPLPPGKIGIASASLMGDAIGVELFNMGYEVVPGPQVEAIVGHNNPWRHDVPLNADILKRLRAYGITSLLTIQSTPYFYTAVPQGGIIRLIDTETLRTLGAVNWDNDDDYFGENALVDSAKKIAYAIAP